MKKKLKDIIARRVETVGVEFATRIAVKGLEERIVISDENNEQINHSIARLKFHIAVLEYLYCDSEEVDRLMKEAHDN